MKNTLPHLVILFYLFLSSSCEVRTDCMETHFAETEFDFVTRERDALGIEIHHRYNLLRSTLQTLENKYGRTGYRDSLLAPIIKSISVSILDEYSAGDIYNEERTQIDRKITNRVKAVFAKHDLELVDLFIMSVNLSDELRSRLENEYREKSERKLPPPFNLKILDRTNWDIKIDTLEAHEFDTDKCQTQPEYLKPVNGDSLLQALTKQYTNIVVSDSCFSVKTSDKMLKHFRREQGDDRRWTGYKAIGYKNDCLMVNTWAYEDGSTLCFNPITGHYTYLTYNPHFIGSDIVWDANDFYGDAEIIITDLRTGKYFGFIIYNWKVTGYCQQGESIFMSFRSGIHQKYLKLGNIKSND